MTGPCDSSLTAMAMKSVSGQNKRRVTEDTNRSRSLFVSQQKGMASCRGAHLTPALAESPEAGLAKVPVTACRQLASAEATAAGEERSVNPGNKGRKEGTAADDSCAWPRCVSSRRLAIVR